MTTAETLRAAATVIRRDGWVRHKRHHPDGGVCALGAIECTYGLTTSPIHSDSLMYAEIERPDAVRAVAALVPHRVRNYYPMGGIFALSGDIAIWNNAADQTAENVALTFELAALLEDEKARGTTIPQEDGAPVEAATV